MSKRVNYTYRGDGSVSKISRFAGAGVNPIGTTTNSYDGMGRLTRISQAPSTSAAISYGYSYDAASRITSMTTPEGTSNFTLDATDQLLSASLTGEAYAYDSSGNRTSGGTITGTGNRLLFDGTYRYAYDAEGNRTAKYIDRDNSQSLSVNDTDVTSYGYDQRNRLVAVSHGNLWTAAQAGALANFSSSGISLPGSDLELRYSYDFADRRIRRSIDADGMAGVGGASVSYAAYAGAIRTLEIAQINNYEVNGRIEWVAGEVAQRNFYGNGVDEILAVELNGNTFWTLGDHQDSVRDIVAGNGASRGQLVEHRQYDSFGKIVRRTTGPAASAPTTEGVGINFGYAGRPLEARTGLSDNRARWYEPGSGKFINEDPSGFQGGDANLYRYVGNDPLDQVDPSGLAARWSINTTAKDVSSLGSFGSSSYGSSLSSLGSSSNVSSLSSSRSSFSDSASLLKPPDSKALIWQYDAWPGTVPQAGILPGGTIVPINSVGLTYKGATSSASANIGFGTKNNPALNLWTPTFDGSAKVTGQFNDSTFDVFTSTSIKAGSSKLSGGISFASDPYTASVNASVEGGRVNWIANARYYDISASINQSGQATVSTKGYISGWNLNASLNFHANSPLGGNTTLSASRSIGDWNLSASRNFPTYDFLGGNSTLSAEGSIGDWNLSASRNFPTYDFLGGNTKLSAEGSIGGWYLGASRNFHANSPLSGNTTLSAKRSIGGWNLEVLQNFSAFNLLDGNTTFRISWPVGDGNGLNFSFDGTIGNGIFGGQVGVGFRW
jgi:RHS repeat-associated protein